MTLGLLSAILASLLKLASPSTDGTRGSMSCAPVTCGSLSITYPFSLAGAQPPYCGYPAFQLTCDGDRAYLTRTFREKLYRVHNITYGNNSLVVAVETTFPGEATCTIPDFNVSASLALFPLNISRTNKDLVFLYNCGHHQGTLLKPACANHSTLGFQNISRTRPGEESKPPQGLPENCSYVTVPVREFQGMEPARDYEKLISDGFLVEWPPKSDADCRECRGRGGECGFVELSFQCFCGGRPCPSSRGSGRYNRRLVRDTVRA